MSRILDLSKHTPIIDGGKRSVYEVPEYPNMLIKVTKKNLKPEKKKFRRELLKILFPSRRDSSIRQELNTYNSLNFKRSEAVLDIFPKFFGLIQTTEGLGLMFEKLSGPDGKLAPTLRTIFIEGGFTQEHLDKLQHVINVLYDQGIAVNGVHAMNFVYSDDRCYLVDGLGDGRAIIPLRRWSKAINRYEYRKKLSRLANGLDLNWNRKTDKLEWKN